MVINRKNIEKLDKSQAQEIHLVMKQKIFLIAR
jgi:hypothetical protein